MRKKRGIFVLLLLTVLLTVSACGDKTPKVYIRRAQLSEKESDVAELLRGDQKAYFFDFVAANGAKSAEIRTYELKDGKWKPVSGGTTFAMSIPTGRIALEFDKIPDGTRISFADNNLFLHQDNAKLAADTAEMSNAVSQLKGPAAADCEKEIPLVIQSFSASGKTEAPTVESFRHPEKYGDKNGDLIYAVTVTFHEKALS